MGPTDWRCSKLHFRPDGNLTIALRHAPSRWASPECPLRKAAPTSRYSSAHAIRARKRHSVLGRGVLELRFHLRRIRVCGWVGALGVLQCRCSKWGFDCKELPRRCPEFRICYRPRRILVFTISKYGVAKPLSVSGGASTYRAAAPKNMPSPNPLSPTAFFGETDMRWT